MSGGASSWGLRSLADTFLRYYQPGLPTYLRFRNTVPDSSEQFVRLGFQASVSGAQSGFTDLEVSPPADVREVSLHNIGLSAGRLNFGARHFLISHTFVLTEMARRGLTDPYQVFRSSDVVGLLYNSRLFSIESITHEEVGAETTLWNITANAVEQATVT